MKLRVTPSVATGTIQSSPSKSYSHRALVLALLADGRSNLKNVLLSGDTVATYQAVQAFGARTSVKGDTVVVDGGKLCCPDKEIDAANSGTTIRIMMGIASLLPCQTVLAGDESLRRRPMQPLIDALNELGVRCSSKEGNGRAPIVVQGPNRGGIAHIPGDVSSQFISSLLISAPRKEVSTEIVLTTPLKSRPYVEITMGMMRRFGAEVERTDDGFFVPGRQRYEPCPYKVPGDYSSAAFPLVAGVLGGGVVVAGLDPDDKQGDRAIVDILQNFGAGIKQGGTTVRAWAEELEGIDVGLADSPDLFPIVALLGTQAKGTTTISNAEHLRVKESDRIHATAEFLRAMGADIEERKDGCVVRGPTELKGARVDSLNDHRILMAAAVAGLIADGTTTITHGDCFNVSYPKFLDDMRSLGAKMEMVG
ncbi:MAG TPA: 3-phosphoshikimate 1-carboxyvinyltransferase [Methanomassiliicoccales archaeon]|nr:3-phosphoshikimate 1-carboxyvinyltransferase [Methanomassiliicoccales archaeon]